MNLIEGLISEIDRNSELLEQYEELKDTPGVNVQFAIQSINNDISAAKQSMSSNDIISMLRTYQVLKENE